MAALPLMAGVAGCGVGGLVGGSSLAVELVNDSDFPVEVTIFTSDEDDIPQSLIDDLGDEIERTIPAGGTVRLSFGCDEVRAIVIDRASLSVVGGLGPVTQTDVLRDEDDFACGDTVALTFDHSSIVFDFAVSTSVRKGQVGDGLSGPNPADVNALLDILLAVLQIAGQSR